MKTQFQRLLTGLCLITSMTTQAATEVSITTRDGAGADVFVENNKPNLGTAALVVKNAATTPGVPHLTRKVYLRFDISGYTDRLADLESATLTLMTSINHLGGSATAPRAYTCYVNGLTIESADNWDENTILWNDAPANVLTDNSLIEGETVDLGLLDIPEVPDPDLVSFSSTELVDFIKTDTNGVITLILRRTDLDASNNLAFHSKETSQGSALENIVPTLRLTIGGGLVDLPFELATGSTELGKDLYQSPWLGRFTKYNETAVFHHLGWLYTGPTARADSMFLYAYNLGSWLWTSETVYPWIYSMNEGWVYVWYTAEAGAYLFNANSNTWRAHNDTGWEFPQSEQELMDALLINIPSTPHPRILFTSKDIPLLREKVKTGWLAELYNVLHTDALLLYRDRNLQIGYSATVGRRIHKAIAKVAFVAYMEDSPNLFRYAIDLALYQIDNYTLDELRLNNPGSPHLGTGDVLHAYGIAYDWLYPQMTFLERAKIKNFMEELGTLQYQDVLNEFRGTDKVADATNHNSVANGGMGLAALALGNKPDWIKHAIQQNRRYLEFSTDADGWNFEGRGYLGYGGWGAFPFAVAIERLGGPDIVAEKPKYGKVPTDFLLRQMPPYITGYGVAVTSLLNTKFHNRVGHWLWLETKTGPGGDYGSGYDVDFLVYTLLWADPALEPLEPLEANLPLDKVFESGRVATRDGWDLDAAVLTYSTGWTVHTGHRVRSENSFNFYALGEEFSISPEDAQTRSEVLHSHVVVDDPRTDRDAGENIHGSTLEESRIEQDCLYIRGDAKNSAVYFIDPKGWTNPDQQKVSEATRQILFVRSPEAIEEPYFVVIDDLTARADTARFSWLFQTKPANTVVLDEDGMGFEITGYKRGAILNVDFIAPTTGLTNEIVSHDGLNDTKGRWSDAKIASELETIGTVFNGKSVRYIAILRAHEAGTTAPAYSFTGTETDGQIMVTLSDGTVDVITIAGNNMSFQRTPGQ